MGLRLQSELVWKWRGSKGRAEHGVTDGLGVEREWGLNRVGSGAGLEAEQGSQRSAPSGPGPGPATCPPTHTL